MPRPRKSIIWTMPKDRLQKIINESASYLEVLRKLGLKAKTGGNYKTLKDRISEDLIDISILEERRETTKKSGKKKTPLDKILINNCRRRIGNQSMKKRLIEAGLLEDKCCLCGNIGSWRNIPLVLQLDHINGKNTDNRVENLRILCPNCHTQTKTYAGKNQKRYKIKFLCKDCRIPIDRTSFRCNTCRGNKDRKFNATEEELVEFIINQKLSYEEIGRKFGVCGATVKKRAKQLHIPLQLRRSPKGETLS